MGAGRPWKSDFDRQVEDGLDIWSCHWACVLVWPDLREFVFRAANTEAKGQVGEVECMLGIMKKARLYEARDEPIDWDCIRRDAEASLPTCHPWMEAVMAYCKSSAGGGGSFHRRLGSLR